ncbi:MAG: universal stress protein [Solirubrobacterales bacterium]
MPRRILVGYEHTEEAAAGLRRAVGLARSERAELTVVHVAVPPPSWVGVGMLALPLVDDVVADGDRLVREAVAELPDDLAVRWHLVTGAGGEHGAVPAPVRAAGAASHARRRRPRPHRAGDRDDPGRVARALLRMCPQRVITAPYAPSVPVGGTPTTMLPTVSLEVARSRQPRSRARPRR